MIFKQIKSGGDRNFAYLAGCQKTRDGALVDPAPDPEAVMKAVNGHGVNIRFIINTHSHHDHSSGNEYFKKLPHPPRFIHCSEDTRVKDGEVLKMGELIIKFIYTPGHTKDSICIKIEDKLLTGDTLFVGKVGGTWSSKDAKTQFCSLKKIFTLPAHTEIWPGHDVGVKPSSTIGFEAEKNPFIKRLSDFDDFLWLKKNWSTYKNEHGIK